MRVGEGYVRYAWTHQRAMKEAHTLSRIRGNRVRVFKGGFIWVAVELAEPLKPYGRILAENP